MSTLTLIVSLLLQCQAPDTVEQSDPEIFQFDEEIVLLPNVITNPQVDPVADYESFMRDESRKETMSLEKNSLYRSWVYHTLVRIIDALGKLAEDLHYNPKLDVMQTLTNNVHRDLAAISAFERLCLEPLNLLGYNSRMSSPSKENVIKAGRMLLSIWEIYSLDY